MKLVQITPGAGAMYCGNCLRDNALVAALRRQGHEVLMVPLYLPLTLDEEDQTRGVPIFYNGVNVYLDQKSRWFRTAPEWLHRVTASRRLLNWASGRAARTRPADTGDITLSMLRGEEGNQARELEQLIAFIKSQPQPDLILLSNVLLAGMARELKRQVGAKIICALQGEDNFLDALPGDARTEAWKILAERCADIDLFIPPTRYFGERMTARLGLLPARVRVVYDGIKLEGYGAEPSPVKPTLGFFARMCPEKGLDTLVEAFILLKQRGKVTGLKLKIGGYCGPAEASFVESSRARLGERNLLGDVEFHPNVDRAGKLEFLRSLSVFSVPALYGEAFGLYVIEALASGVPVVQPSHAAFPELLGMTGGGLLCEAGSAAGLAGSIEELLLNPGKARELGAAGRRAVLEKFDVNVMTAETVRVCQELLLREKPARRATQGATA